MRSSRRRRDEEGRCKEAEKGGPGIKRHKGRRRKRKRRPCNKKIKKKEKTRTLEIGIRAGSACNDRGPIREHTRDPPRYLSVWNFLRWESLFLIENNKNPKNRTSFFVFSSSSFLFFLSFFFLDFDFFTISFFFSSSKKSMETIQRRSFIYLALLSIFFYDWFRYWITTVFRSRWKRCLMYFA